MTPADALPLIGAAALALALVPNAAAAREDDDLRAEITRDLPELMELYRQLHAHPELSFQEVRTAATLAGEVRRLGFEVTEKVGRTGVVAVLRNGEGPTILIRTDMDALPVEEQTGLAFASKARGVPASGVEGGVMHACGHDTHMTAWVESARLLAARKNQWSGTLVMIAQPAEETGEGARAMLDDGLYTRFPRPERVLAFHDAAQLPAGQIGFTSGFTLANVDSVDIKVRGVGGHGAYPHTTRDPIVIASAIVMRLQTLVSRESDPVEPGVVTVGSFHAGSKHNIIPAEARLQLTVRSYSEAQRKLLLEGIARIAKGEAIAAGLGDELMPEVRVQQHYTPATYNDPEFTAEVMAGLRERFGEARVASVPPVMGGEDFSQYRRADPERIKSLIFWVGAASPDRIAAAQSGGKPLPSLHSPFFAPEAEAVVATAAEALTATALRLMPRSAPANAPQH